MEPAMSSLTISSLHAPAHGVQHGPARLGYGQFGRGITWMLIGAMALWLLGCAAPAINPRQPATENEVLANIQQLTHGFVRTGSPTFSPSMRWIAFQATVAGEPGEQVFVAPLQLDNPSAAGLGRPIRVTPIGSINGGVCFSPDGNSLLIASSGPTGTVQAQIPTSGPATKPAIMRLFRSDGWEPAVIAAAPGTIVDLTRFPITPANTIATQPAWSPDGKRIAFTRKAQGNVDVVIANADGIGPIPVTHSPAMEGYPAFSPDGTHLLFASAGARQSSASTRVELYTCKLNFDARGAFSGASQTRAVTRNIDAGRSGDWSPDGRRLVYSVFND
jgi:Tol biopolymer transport system component